MFKNQLLPRTGGKRSFLNRILKRLGVYVVRSKYLERLQEYQYTTNHAPGLLRIAYENKNRPVIICDFGLFVYNHSLSVGFQESGIFYLHHDHGLFSCMSAFLWSLVDLVDSKAVCTKVDNTFSMNLYKQRAHADEWKSLFEEPCAVDAHRLSQLNPLLTRHDSHKPLVKQLMSHDSMQWIEQVFKTYFKPSPAVQEKIDFMIQKYELTGSPFICVYVRGTDKISEVPQLECNMYFPYIDKYLAKSKDIRLLIQTDQASIRKTFIDRYRGRAFTIDEIFCGKDGATGLHLRKGSLDKNIETSHFLLGLMHILKMSKALITCQSHVAYFFGCSVLIGGGEVWQPFCDNLENISDEETLSTKTYP